MGLAPIYEAAPSKDLPRLDLSRSLGSEVASSFGRLFHRRSDRVSTITVATLPTSTIRDWLLAAELPVEHQWTSKMLLYVYYGGHAFAAIACIVPALYGTPLAIIGLALTLPGSICSIALLRFDVLQLQARTYEFWFYVSVSTVSVVLLALGFNDARGCIAVLLWLGNFHTIAVDANTWLVCHLVLASVITVALNLFVLLAMESSAIPEWRSQFHTFQQLSQSQDGKIPFDSDNLISNGLVTMSIVLCRNIYRRHTELRQQRKINCPMLRCLNLRCQIRLQVIEEEAMARLHALATPERNYAAGPRKSDQCSIQFPLSQMYNVRVQQLFDSAHTFYPVQLHPLRWTQWERLAFVALGSTGLALTATVVVVHPLAIAQPIAIAGVCSTMLFLLVSLGLFQREACRQIITSFDYLFLSAQFSLGLWCAATLFNWDTRSIALASIWLWLHWVITSDALTPLMKDKIGLNTKFLLVPVLLLFAAAQIALMLELRWLDRWAIQDRVLLTVAGRFQMSLLPFLWSRVVMSFLWTLRLLWRIVHSESADAVILLGRVAYMYKLLPQEMNHDTKHQPTLDVLTPAKQQQQNKKKKNKLLSSVSSATSQVAPFQVQ